MRRSGVLLHLTSLPSPGGIGTLGKDAYAFVDWLKLAGMSIWQVLPVGPTGYGDSPYQSPGTHAGNPMLIDLELLKRDGLLDADATGFKACSNRHDIKALKERALRLSFDQSYHRVEDKVNAFARAHPDIDDFAMFMAVKDYFEGCMWTKWPDVAIRMREESALKHYGRVLRDDINFHRYAQYLFYTQWQALKAYANKRGVSIFGDMPIYVAEDSADTWANPSMFQLDQDRRPIKVAGVPPDYFSEDGQLWGNPLYDWKALKRDGYQWWLNRLRTAGELYDMVRVDHFIGFANYYAIRAGATNARLGKWEKAPGRSFFFTVKRKLPGLNIIAEDLGEVNKRVKRLLRYCGYPGMKVLCFGFDSDETNPHFPANVHKNSVVYTGTHDNDTALGWWEKASDGVKAFARAFLPDRDSICLSMIEAALGSEADTAILPMQDILQLNSDARMNAPGTVGGQNWQWRMAPDALTDELADSLRDLNEFYERKQT